MPIRRREFPREAPRSQQQRSSSSSSALVGDHRAITLPRLLFYCVVGSGLMLQAVGGGLPGGPWLGRMWAWPSALSSSLRCREPPPEGEGVSVVYHSPDQVPHQVLSQLDAVLILGGGVPTSLDQPPIYVQRRCDDAAALLKRRQQQQQQQLMSSSSSSSIRSNASSSSSSSLPLLCLSAGTAHLPQLMAASSGLPIWESTACAAYLERQHGLLPPHHEVLVETTSYDTIGNAFFARTNHVDLAGWRRLLIITSEFHMERTQAIFDWIFAVEATHSSGPSPPYYELYFLASPNVGLTEEAILARRTKERQSLSTIQQYRERYRSLSEVWHFLTHQHALYTAHDLVARGRPMAPAAAGAANELIRKSYGGTGGT